MKGSGERPPWSVWFAVLASVAITACSRTGLDLDSEESAGIPGPGTGVDASMVSRVSARAREGGQRICLRRRAGEGRGRIGHRLSLRAVV